MNEQTKVLSLKTSSEGMLTFETLDDVEKFLQEQRAYYNSLLEGATEGQNHHNIRTGLNNKFASLLAQINTFRSEGKAPEVPLYALEELFSTNRIPTARSPQGRFLSKIKASDGNGPTAAALITLAPKFASSVGINIAEPLAQMRGSFLAFAFNDDIGSARDAASREAVEALISELRDTLNTYKADLSTQRALFDETNAVSTEAFERQRSHFALAIESAIEDIKNVQKDYDQFMQLKAPVDYWSQKAEIHHQKSRNYRRTLLWFSVIAAMMLTLLLYFISAHVVAIADAGKPTAVYLTYVTLGVVISTMAFWAARILVRLFMSEHHLAIDSEERAVMAKTYLALTKDKAADEKDRSIILTSLFRPTADGIVKDDAAPELSPSALIRNFYQNSTARPTGGFYVYHRGLSENAISPQ